MEHKDSKFLVPFVEEMLRRNPEGFDLTVSTSYVGELLGKLEEAGYAATEVGTYQEDTVVSVAKTQEELDLRESER